MIDPPPTPHTNISRALRSCRLLDPHIVNQSGSKKNLIQTASTVSAQAKPQRDLKKINSGWNRAEDTDETLEELSGMHLHYARHYELHGQNDPVRTWWTCCPCVWTSVRSELTIFTVTRGRRRSLSLVPIRQVQLTWTLSNLYHQQSRWRDSTAELSLYRKLNCASRCESFGWWLQSWLWVWRRWWLQASWM